MYIQCIVSLRFFIKKLPISQLDRIEVSDVLCSFLLVHFELCNAYKK